MSLHMFFCMNQQFIIGEIQANYVGSYQIYQPALVLKNGNGSVKIEACNLENFSDDKYSINIEKFKILYTLNQDFIPPEVLKLYYEFINQHKVKEVHSNP
jgi:hypothetical protein